MSDGIKTSHVLRLMTRLQRMKENKIICDFTIKVGNKSFPVHRTVLVASSDYFEGMFSSNMKEVREGFVEMKGLGVNSFEQSLEFIYTGTAKITTESVQEILHVAELFQLDGLKNLCFQFLLDNLSPNNCLSVVNLAVTYKRPDVKEKAERIVTSDLDAVVSSDMFPLISRCDLLRYISSVKYQTSWKAAITWAQDKEEFPQLIERMDIKKFPFKFLLESVLEEPFVKKHESVKKLVIGALFSDAENLKNYLNPENCINLKFLAQNYDINDAIIDVIMGYIEENFEQIVAMPNFCDIDRDDIIRILRSPGTKCSSEKMKWEAALKWVKHEVRKRKNVFPELFSQIKLEAFPSKFLRDTIRNENLVTSSKKCTEALMDAVLGKAVNLEENQDSQAKDAPASSVTAANTPHTVIIPDAKKSPRNIIIDQQPANGVMNTGNCIFVENNLITITYSFPAGYLRDISYPVQYFWAYLPSGSGFYSRLEKAFRAGQIFRLGHQMGETRGKIIWGDIPHKTSRTGGPCKNGYPDPGYLTRLDQALKAKGF